MQTQELLQDRRGDYGYDAPRQGLLPTGGAAAVFGSLAALHRRTGRRLLAQLELLASACFGPWFVMYLHTTRRGKFLVWAEILSDLVLRGDEQVLDMGCGRGGVPAMATCWPCRCPVRCSSSSRAGASRRGSPRNLLRTNPRTSARSSGSSHSHVPSSDTRTVKPTAAVVLPLPSPVKISVSPCRDPRLVIRWPVWWMLDQQSPPRRRLPSR